jgi:hypothetical protein
MDPEVEHQWNLNAEKATSQTNKLQVQKKKNSYQENYQMAAVDGMSMTTAERQNVLKTLHIHVRIIFKKKT